MNSFNHYAYGAVGEWMYRVAAGIDVDDQHPGYKKFHLRPRPGGAFTWMKVGLNTQYGDIRSDWSVESGNITYSVVIPPNTTAIIRLPKAAGKTITLNGSMVTAQTENEDAVLEKGSGTYIFTYPFSFN
jgi:alpha-L-rhamnosidase